MSAVLDYGTIGPKEAAVVRACGLDASRAGHAGWIVDRWIFAVVCLFDIEVEHDRSALSRALERVQKADGAPLALSVLLAETPDRVRRSALVAYLGSIGALS